MEKLQKIEKFQDLGQATESYKNLYDAYEASIRTEESYRQLYEFETKRASKLEAKLSAITSIVNI